jgi:exopolysaccharide biosynthesis WecB/TagA/CpsF family protein/anti-anti-sigma factor
MIEKVIERPNFAHPPIAILGVPFDNVTAAETIATIDRMVASRQPHYLVTANVDFLVQAQEDVELRRILFDAHLVLCDGTPLVWASRLLGNPLLERVAGADLVPLLLRAAAEKGYRVFFLGATPESAKQAVDNLKKLHPTLIIPDYYSPPFNKLLEMDHDEIKRRILAAKPDLLFVSLGCPKQEKWIAMHYRSLGVPVSAGVGATIDFLAGTVKRAPLWMQRVGMEWIYRLAQEPRRLFKRYFKDLWVFGWKILGQLWQLQLRSSAASKLFPRKNQHWIQPPVDGDLQSSQSFSLSQRDFRRLGSGERNPAERGGPLGPSERERASHWAGVRGIATPPDSFRSATDEPNWQLIKLPERLDLAAVCNDALLADGLLADGRHCLLEMSHVQFIDSTGVGMLIRLQKKIRATGCQLVLLAPSAKVRQALALMQLQNFFASAPDLASAQELIAARTREETGAVRLRSPAAINPLLWQGEITAANAKDVWDTTETHLTSKQRRELVIDMSGVRFMDSTGLGMMVRAKKLAQREQVKLEFVHLQPAVQNVVQLARLQEYLLARNNREHAVN